MWGREPAHSRCSQNTSHQLLQMMGTVKTRHLPSAALGLPAIPMRVPGPLLSYPLDVFGLTPGACWETVLYPQLTSPATENAAGTPEVIVALSSSRSSVLPAHLSPHLSGLRGL